MRSKPIVTIAALTAAFASVALGVEAQRGGRGGQGGAASSSDAIQQALGELRWGMEPREVHEYFVNRIRQRYREPLSEAPGAIEEDRIRHEMNQEIRRLRESYVRFDGERTGWDVSFLQGEFTHGNRESMLVYRDENSQNFYFFIRGRLWKWFKAFDASVFRGQGFEQFAAAVQGRFGDAAERSGRLTRRGPRQRWLEWQDATTRLRAIDHNRFYGFYCLVFEDQETLERLDELRSDTIEPGDPDSHALVDSVVADGEEGGADSHADIVDRITGRIRRRPSRDEAAETSDEPRDNAERETSRSGADEERRSSDRLDLSDL